MTGTSWRSRIRVHPAADLPEMSDAELIDLGKDIDDNGLQQPIILYRERARRGRRGLEPDGEVVILDGVNRLLAMEKVGIELFTENGNLWPNIRCNDGDPVKLVFGRWSVDRDKWHDEVEPYSYVISANAQRRHLDRDQKREIVAKLLKAKPERSDRQIAAIAKVDHKTVAAVRTGAEGRGEIPHVEARADTKGRQQPARKTAAPERKPEPLPTSPAVQALTDAMAEKRKAWASESAPNKDAPQDQQAVPVPGEAPAKPLTDKETIAALAALLRKEPNRGLWRIEHALNDTREAIAEMPLAKRVTYGRLILAALDVTLADLAPAAEPKAKVPS